ncbi:MAG: hypothetical protein KJ755_20780 [Alphaproteobacteria bacterium]|nr:hypothetical protein [Alphaproteobacteria bacterium]
MLYTPRTTLRHSQRAASAGQVSISMNGALLPVDDNRTDERRTGRAITPAKLTVITSRRPMGVMREA